MAKITIDGKELTCRDGISALQAALDAGWDVPHYCYHPGLSIVASCRLCLMEMKMPNPRTKELEWAPKLVPGCQTPVREGLEVRFASPAVESNQLHVMEYYLVNHPLDCPVCDKAGECSLQDYSFRFGKATSRAIDPKHKNPKKDIGSKTLLYQDRCVLCSRCVRFTREVAGTGELCVVNRGDHGEIDVFPGQPLENPLQGNVVDLCPVGALLDKDFLFEQRVWFLRGHDSVCRACSTGCAIRADENRNSVYRLKPRYNPGVNDWWMCDEGRFGWKFIADEGRITAPRLRRGSSVEVPAWSTLPAIVSQRFEAIVAAAGPGSLAAQLSPEMSCEEAWLLAGYMRSIDPQAALALGEVQTVGEDQRFPVGCAPGAEKFVIRAEKNPNRKGIETILEAFGGAVDRAALAAGVASGKYKGVWIAGGYPVRDWPGKEIAAAAPKAEFLVVQDLFKNRLTAAANLVLPGCVWLEREGSFMNHAGLVQPFKAAVKPPEGARSDGRYLYELWRSRQPAATRAVEPVGAGLPEPAHHPRQYDGPDVGPTQGPGLFSAQAVRELMAREIPAFERLHVPPPMPEHQH